MQAMKTAEGGGVAAGGQRRGGEEQAELFFHELLGSCDSLQGLAEEFGHRTFTDLMYLQNAILTGKQIDVWPGETRVVEVLERLNSSKLWLSYTKPGGVWAEACERSQDDGDAQGAVSAAGRDQVAGVTCYAGHLTHDGVRVQVDFEAPSGASAVELDAAFLGALAQQAQVEYLAIGSR